MYNWWDFLYKLNRPNVHYFVNFLTFVQVASFPFDDHNCPPIHLIKLFCQSAYSWLKEDILNVVVVHCKAGKARTGLMICSLLLFLKVKIWLTKRIPFSFLGRFGCFCLLSDYFNIVNCSFSQLLRIALVTITNKDVSMGRVLFYQARLLVI